MHQIDLSFRLTGTWPLPVDHGYALYGGVSRLLPEVHRENGIALHPIRGRQIGNRQLSLTDHSRLTLRVPDDCIADFLPLAGKALRIGDGQLRIGIPEVRSLIASPAVRSRLVIIKVAHTTAATLTAETFTAAVRRQLDTLGISPNVIITLGKRRTLRIKQREIVGYEVIVEGLSAPESLTLQQSGLGGRHHMGCGVFVGLRDQGESK